MPKKPYYITTAIAYTSGKPHIGNTYEVVLADSIARYRKDMTYFSRQELTNMVRRSRLKHLRISPHRRNSWMRHRLRSSVSGI